LVIILSISYKDTLILNAIEKGLDALGESPKQAIWVYLETQYNIDKNKPINIREFQSALQKIFGLGYNFLDTIFCKYLKEETEQEFSDCDSFVECVELLQRRKSVCITKKSS